MQHPENNMDDLFREAADHYPLKVTGADWNRVNALLLKEKPAQKPAGRNRKFLWLLTLLLIPFVCTVLRMHNGDLKTGQLTEKNISTINQPHSASTATARTPQLFVTNPAAVTGTVVAGVNSQNINTASTSSKNKNTVDPAGELANALSKKFQTKRRTAMQISSGSSTDNTNAAGEKIVTMPDEDEVVIAAVPPATNKENRKTIPVKDTAAAQPEKKNEAVAKTATPGKKKQQKMTKLYVNLLAAPDLTRVKSSEVKHIGGSAGLTLGYNINKHFAVEAGALYSVKHYTSDPKYFNNEKTQWPTNRVITGLEGTCKMIELPLTLRYNFNLQSKNKLFAAAGLSSYLMKRESYEYEYEFPNIPAVQSEAYKTYNNSSRNWLSVLQFSAGWQRNLGRLGALRLQPYVNIPLGGVGIGKLPLSGFGMLGGLSIPIK